MPSTVLTFTIPGTAWYECLDPNASAMQAELGLPDPIRRRRGKGHQFTYTDVPVEVVKQTAEHLYDMGTLWLANTDDSAERSRYRTLMKTGERLLREVAHA